ncbi:Uncharacterised protein [Kluyvera cryocrescens]|uniref:Uncharacterized protein n=1 Tax=Kluyvera cryocrescens TaxID=580 RepID=A0A485BH65_KLUCR|nr:Uncharacterised protein [Kluyvera cryocrescens]
MKFAREQNSDFFCMQMNQRFAADLRTKTDIVRIIKLTVGDDLQPFISRTDNLLTRQNDMNINILTMVFRTLFGERFGFAFYHVKKKIISVDDVFSGGSECGSAG